MDTCSPRKGPAISPSLPSPSPRSLPTRSSAPGRRPTLSAWPRSSTPRTRGVSSATSGHSSGRCSDSAEGVRSGSLRAMPAPALSKSRYLSGLQCHKKLWWEVHEQDAPELRPEENQLVIFDVGAQVGAAARERVPGGTLIIGKASEGSVKVEQTRRAIAEGAGVIYEATFAHERVYASVDILERVGDGWRLTEVKSTVEAKEEHVPDVAVQTWVARGAGLPVVASHLMHLNRECR